MVNVARAIMHGQIVGTFRWDQKAEVALFEYDHDFISRGVEPSPLMMPVRQGRIYSFRDLGRDTFHGLPGMLADSLPDTYGQALFEKWLSLTGHTSSNPIESLCFMGKRCMGALEYEPALDTAINQKARFEIDSLVEVARDALSQKTSFSVSLNDDRKTAIAEILRLGTSAGGQRAKAIIAYNKKTGEVRSGQTDAPEGFEHYIIKLDGVSAKAGFRETENFGRLEYSFARLARKCGINMTECVLAEENGRAHFLTRRFDRKDGRKIHMQTLCGIAHLDHRLHHTYSYEQAFSVMRAMRLSYSEAREMFRRMVFNVVVRNQDDHTKNISFLMEESGKWHLSPAYDMGYAFNPFGGWTATHQMSINGKFDDITRQDLLAFAISNNIKDADDIIDEVREASSHWKEIADDCGVPPAMAETIMNDMRLNL